MKHRLCIFIFIASVIHAGLYDESLQKRIDYTFLLQDTPARLFTMQQINETYLSSYRLFSRGVYSLVENSGIADIIQLSASCFYFMTFTHEEGHRAVLTNENIGSISDPYLSSRGAAYVKGVHNRTLQELRDNNLPVYIRLHTAGLESDFMLTKRIETIGAFGFDSYAHYRWEYLIRKFSIVQYYLLGLLEYDLDLKEEGDELECDIVGFDTYGTARHLYRPTMEFYRYTHFDDLTSEEKKFIQRAGYRSLLNLMNPLIIGRERFKINDHISGSAGAGYTMAPFGDFIDEQFWLSVHNKVHINWYFRQFQNHRSWFVGFGGGIVHYAPIEAIAIDIEGHFWQQPEALDFKTEESFSGGAIDANISYFILSGKPPEARKGVSIDVGFLYKTEGFMPEVMSLDEHIGFKIGTTLRW